MKKINTRTSIHPITNNDYFANSVDTKVQSIDIRCNHCGGPIKITEAYINQQQGKIIDNAISALNDLINDINLAVIEVYGNDARANILAQKLNELRKKFASPDLKIIRKEGDSID